MGLLESPVPVIDLGGNETETGQNLCDEHGKIIARMPSVKTPIKSKEIEKTEADLGASLGIYATSSTPPCAPGVSAQLEFVAKRSKRYQLLDAAQRIIVRKGKSELLEHPRTYHKTAQCSYIRLCDNPGIGLSKKTGKACFQGIIFCGNPFTCPLCAPKIQERRREEIAQAFDWAYGDQRNSLKVIMVTFTFPHNRWQELGDLLRGQYEAYKKLRAGNPWKRIKDSIGYAGLIRSLEVTHGQNGWHPHTHEAWIVSKDADVDSLKNKIANRWLKMCQKVGLASNDPQRVLEFLQHAIHITDNCSTSEYLAKQDDSKHWGADREIASGSAKQGMAKGQHPFGFLEDYLSGDRKSAKLYLEFLDGMRRKAQVFWTPGLKKKVGVGEVSDEEAAETDDNEIEDLSLFNKHQWSLIAKNRLQGQVLFIFETGGFDGVLAFLRNAEKVDSQMTQELPSTISVQRENVKADMDESIDYRQTIVEFTTNQKRSPDIFENADIINAAGICSDPKQAAHVVISLSESRLNNNIGIRSQS